MVLYVFNADNDMALAKGEPGYTAPASIRKMMQQTALLPARWAAPGDGVLTDKGVWIVERRAGQQEDWAETLNTADPHPKDGHWTTLSDILPQLTEVRPWGWSPAICHRLHLAGIPEHLLPTKEQLAEIRRLSSRERAVELLRDLRQPSADATTITHISSIHRPLFLAHLMGESCFCTNEEAVEKAFSRWSRTILKAPWSGSGKGIRYGQGGREDTLRGWVQRILKEQGGVVVEPFYDKAYDFAMEFWSDGAGHVDYSGLSIFDTHPNGAYKGNRLWSEERKQEWLCEEIKKLASPDNLEYLDSLDKPDKLNKSVHLAPQELLRTLQDALELRLAAMIGTAYRGPLGVDMMLLKNGCIHPCVEINLRMTMGYAALL